MHMMPSIETTPNLSARLAPSESRYAQCTPAARKFAAYAVTVMGKLRDLAPYAAIELVLPGGSLMALLLWIYRRQQNVDRPGSPGWLGLGRSASSIQVGAWSLGFSQPRTSRCTPAARSRGAASGFISK